MKVKQLVWTLVIAILGVTATAAFISNQAVNPKMIKQLAPVQDAYLLRPKTHIRHTQRPEETYSFPIKLGETGPVLPLFSGPIHYPFICMTEESGLGEPLIDNQNKWGTPVFKTNTDRLKHSSIAGYSKDCSIKTAFNVYKVDSANTISKFNPETQLETGEYLVRVEYGVINRYIYLIAMPITLDEINTRTAASQWNKKLIYQFTGGAGIGFRQGTMKPEKLIKRRLEQLKAGYAVVASGANRTSYTYNMLLSEDTARRLKAHFVSLYNEPEYTVGVGGSGGGLAQYLMAQNAPGLIDGALPLYSYPDMVSQTLYALDCDLFNSFYSFKTSDSFWQNWDNRVVVEGLNTKSGEPHPSALFQPINQILKAQKPIFPEGNSECINGWFGLYAFIHNPKQGWLRDYVSDKIESNVQWNYWQDLVNIYGRDRQGFARHLWGNEGVQYGLKSLINQQLTIEQFIELNKKIGSWKHNAEMQPEQILKLPLADTKIWLSLWGNHNITQVDKQSGIAPRLQTDPLAVERAYRYGQIFAGLADIPIIDVRHYLEDKLDMHHASASFNSRARMQQTQGHSDNQIIWIADKNYNPVVLAFEKMDKWLMQIKAGKSLLAAKPKNLEDQCFDRDGEIIASGQNVWDGEWNRKPEGACTQQFKIYQNSRIIAGDSWKTNTFDCARVPVEQAIEQGVYGQLDISPYLKELQVIFPTGVCDYTQPDQAKPDNLALSWPSPELEPVAHQPTSR